ncbi:MAG: cytoskeleton protein RodZ [Pseudomonadota bacterium]|nr:cytoskeleton protein RodZ [Pseudomonadota bacterium]
MSEESLNADNANKANNSKADELIRQVEFGIYLREARQAAGLSTLDVADRLKLGEDIIKALETSRIDILPAAAFTQGYIKAYAKLLKISSDEIMRAYDQMVPNKIASLNVTSGVPVQRSSRDSLVKITSYVLVILALVLFAFWVQQSGFELSGNLVQQIGQAEQPEQLEQPVDQPMQSDPYPVDGLTGDPVAVMDADITEASPVAAPTDTAADRKNQTAEKSRSEKTPEIKTEIKPVQKTAVIPATKPAPVAAVAPEQNSTVVMGGDIISLSASAESWAEVLDADNNRLYYSLMKTGDAHAIKGRAPFKVFLGNAPSVSLKVNDQAVDISRYIRQNNIAHIKITARATTQTGGPRENVNQVTDQYVPETSGTSRTD